MEVDVRTRWDATAVLGTVRLTIESTMAAETIAS
jgi:hypothetical protein